MELIKLGKRKITARRYSQIDEGKLKVYTPKGWIRPAHGDYLLPIDKTHTLILNGDAMDYLMKKDETHEKDVTKESETNEELSDETFTPTVEIDEHVNA